MKVLIVDDEAPARARLIALLSDCDDVQVVGEASNGREAIAAVQQLHPELVLMDIRMPVMDGLEAARCLAQTPSPPAVIFCTAYDEHALAAFEAKAVDYLVKPIRLARLRTAIEQARRFTGVNPIKALASTSHDKKRTHICARVRGNLMLVPVTDIFYLLAEDKYVVVHYTHGEVLIEEALKNLELEFSDHFIRIHRNCLVALNRLAGLTRAHDGRIFIQLTDVKTPLEVSRRNLPALRKLVRSL